MTSSRTEEMIKLHSVMKTNTYRQRHRPFGVQHTKRPLHYDHAFVIKKATPTVHCNCRVCLCESTTRDVKHRKDYL